MVAKHQKCFLRLASSKEKLNIKHIKQKHDDTMFVSPATFIIKTYIIYI